MKSASAAASDKTTGSAEGYFEMPWELQMELTRSRGGSDGQSLGWVRSAACSIPYITPPRRNRCVLTLLIVRESRARMQVFKDIAVVVRGLTFSEPIPAAAESAMTDQDLTIIKAIHAAISSY
jgi:hypothetical protein